MGQIGPPGSVCFAPIQPNAGHALKPRDMEPDNAHGGAVMASGRLFLAATLSLSAIAAVPSFVFAQESAQTETEGKHTFIGKVNANAVYVRSRPSEDGYPTMKLSKDAEVTVVGMKANWLKIVPPDGSFAYVPKSFII